LKGGQAGMYSKIRAELKDKVNNRICYNLGVMNIRVGLVKVVALTDNLYVAVKKRMENK